MKTEYITITIAACLMAGSCSNPPPSTMTTTRYAMLAGSKSAKDQPMMMEFSIREPGKKPVAFTPRRVVTGKTVSFVSDRESIYPSAYLPAEISASDASPGSCDSLIITSRREFRSRVGNIKPGLFAWAPD